VALVLVMLVSALERMRLYRLEYGLTELRFYTTAFMIWLGALLVWFAVTVLPGRRAAFARGALASAVVAVAALHAVDPERVIVETNRAMPRTFDAEYASGLSADAVPALVEAVQPLEGPVQRRLARTLLTRWASDEPPDWRSWSLARARARSRVLSEEPRLRAVLDEAEAEARQP
jgi:hypothetical protein